MHIGLFPGDRGVTFEINTLPEVGRGEAVEWLVYGQGLSRSCELKKSISLDLPKLLEAAEKRISLRGSVIESVKASDVSMERLTGECDAFMRERDRGWPNSPCRRRFLKP